MPLPKNLIVLISAGFLTAATGCASVGPLESRVRQLSWKLDSAEQVAEQSVVDKRLAQRETKLARRQARVLRERLALAYDALREADPLHAVCCRDKIPVRYDQRERARAPPSLGAPDVVWEVVTRCVQHRFRGRMLKGDHG